MTSSEWHRTPHTFRRARRTSGRPGRNITSRASERAVDLPGTPDNVRLFLSGLRRCHDIPLSASDAVHPVPSPQADANAGHLARPRGDARPALRIGVHPFLAPHARPVNVLGTVAIRDARQRVERDRRGKLTTYRVPTTFAQSDGARHISPSRTAHSIHPRHLSAAHDSPHFAPPHSVQTPSPPRKCPLPQATTPVRLHAAWSFPTRTSCPPSRRRCSTTSRPGTPHNPPGRRRLSLCSQSDRRLTSRRDWRLQAARLRGALPRTSRRSGARRPRTGGASPR